MCLAVLVTNVVETYQADIVHTIGMADSSSHDFHNALNKLSMSGGRQKPLSKLQVPTKTCTQQTGEGGMLTRTV